MDKEKKFVSFVVYLHNAGKEIEKFLSDILDVADSRFCQYEIICVDDMCTDDTMDKISGIVSSGNLSSMISIVHMSYYQGLESAMNAGRDLAIGDFVFEFDSTYIDYDMSVLDEIYLKLLEGYDIVSASSDGRTKITSKLFYSVFNAFSRVKMNRIKNESVRIISRRAINRVKAMGLYIPYRKAVYANCGLKTANISYKCIAGPKKKTKTSERLSLAFDSFVYFTDFLQKISTFLSVVFLLTTVGIGIYTLSDIIFKRNTVEGWLSIMGLLSIGFFGIFVLLTVILKYLATILNLVFKQQRYIVSDIEKITPKE